MGFVYCDAAGHRWPAVIDVRTRRKVGRAEFASFAVHCPMPSYRAHVKVVKDESKLKPHQAAKV